ncbi:MAG: GH3 auxin-responsive promoter family protein [Dehalococcoidales bacterium]|nr:GH3 auxin-responsive promoter family protein [Dehalococcoidales bacterium]
MATAGELLSQGRNAELWNMCCGFLQMDLPQFMTVQKRLLMEQIGLLNHCELGKKIFGGVWPVSVEEFRRLVPLTRYADYCPEFMEKREDFLPARPAFWVRTSGRTSVSTYKWVPMTSTYAQELSRVLYGIGILSSCPQFGETSHMPIDPKILYSVAPRPYTSGMFADVLRTQSPIEYLPFLDEAENLPFEERIKLGFQQAMSEGLDFFFGLSLVLVAVGNKFRESTGKVDLRPYLSNPKALLRLAKGVVKSKLAHRPLLPKDLWAVKGIIGSGVDSWVYKDKIKELWGKYPLDLYSCTEGGVIATQTCDYENMTFVPNLNFLEFIPEEELSREQSDRNYQPKTILLDEVKAGGVYEIVLTNFHGGAMVRYRIGDMVRITALRNDNLGIIIPQMAFERRADDLLNFMVIKLTEKQIWQAIEHTGLAYVDWTAYKIPGETVLHLLIELKDNIDGREAEVKAALQKQIIASGRTGYDESGVAEDWRDSLDFSVAVTFLPRGAFAGYTAQKQAEGADLAHLKPPHINPREEVLAALQVKPEVRVRVRPKTPAPADAGKVAA